MDWHKNAPKESIIHETNSVCAFLFEDLHNINALEEIHGI